MPSCFAQELIDDVDKLSLVEAAVILNAYAHFNCAQLKGWLYTALHGFGSAVRRSAYLARAQWRALHHAGVNFREVGSRWDVEWHGVSRYGSQAADPQTLAVLCKAFASLKHKAGTLTCDDM